MVFNIAKNRIGIYPSTWAHVTVLL